MSGLLRNARKFLSPGCYWLAISLSFSQTTPPPPGQIQPAQAPPIPISPAQTAPARQTPPAAPAQQSSIPAPPSDITKLPPESPVEFESKGLDYEALTHDGITVMFTHLPPHIKDFSILQVTVTNGSLVSWTVRPNDFAFIRQDGAILPALSADYVVESLLAKASRNDVIKLTLLYEDSIYGLQNFRSTNGYEKRRQAALAMFVNREFKAAAAASAITFIPTKLKPTDSTDGAVFFENRTKEKTLGPGRLVVRTCGQTFVFQTTGEMKIR